MAKIPATLALLGLLAASHPGIAQPAKAPPKPQLELALGPGFQWFEPGLLLVRFELRNMGEEPLIVSQQPGVLLGVSCQTEDGFRGTVPGGITCGSDRPGHRYSLMLEPGQGLQGEKVVRVPEDCVGDITVEGLFQTVTARGWELPSQHASIRSKPLEIGQPDKP
jgi:hypothetical protein